MHRNGCLIANIHYLYTLPHLKQDKKASHMQIFRNVLHPLSQFMVCALMGI